MADDEAAAAEAPAAEPAAEEPAAEAPAEAPPSPPAEEAAAEEPAAEPPAAPPPFQRQPSTAEEEKAAEKIEAVVRGKEARQRVEQKRELTKKLSSRGVMSAKKTAEHFDEELARQQSLESVGSKKEWDDGNGAPAAADAKRRPSLGSAKGSRGASKTPEKGRGKSKSPGKERPAAKPAAKPPPARSARERKPPADPSPPPARAARKPPPPKMPKAGVVFRSGVDIPAVAARPDAPFAQYLEAHTRYLAACKAVPIESTGPAARVRKPPPAKPEKKAGRELADAIGGKAVAAKAAAARAMKAARAAKTVIGVAQGMAKRALTQAPEAGGGYAQGAA